MSDSPESFKRTRLYGVIIAFGFLFQKVKIGKSSDMEHEKK